MTDPITAAIRRTIAAAEPMWRDTAIDKLTGEIAQAVRAETPQPATTDDAVERAARAWHQEAERQSECLMGDWDALDPGDRARALRRMRAALAAALTAAGGRVDPRETDDEQGVRLLRENRDYWRAVAEARTADLRDERAAQRGGAEVDGEAVQRRVDLTLKSVARFADRTAKTPGERQSIIAALAEAQADVALLAARGDATTPTVTAEQAERMAVHIADWLSDTGVSDAHREAITDALREAGIEVRP